MCFGSSYDGSYDPESETGKRHGFISFHFLKDVLLLRTDWQDAHIARLRSDREYKRQERENFANYDAYMNANYHPVPIQGPMDTYYGPTYNGGEFKERRGGHNNPWVQSTHEQPRVGVPRTHSTRQQSVHDPRSQDTRRSPGTHRSHTHRTNQSAANWDPRSRNTSQPTETLPPYSQISRRRSTGTNRPHAQSARQSTGTYRSHTQGARQSSAARSSHTQGTRQPSATRSSRVRSIALVDDTPRRPAASQQPSWRRSERGRSRSVIRFPSTMFGSHEDLS